MISCNSRADHTSSGQSVLPHPAGKARWQDDVSKSIHYTAKDGRADLWPQSAGWSSNTAPHGCVFRALGCVPSRCIHMRHDTWKHRHPYIRRRCIVTERKQRMNNASVWGGTNKAPLPMVITSGYAQRSSGNVISVLPWIMRRCVNELPCLRLQSSTI